MSASPSDVERGTTDSDVAELYHIEQTTSTDGTAEVEILGWERSRGGGKVRVEFLSPEMEREWMEWPLTLDSESKFVRLLDSYGYALGEADKLEHETTEARLNGEGEWELRIAPENHLARLRLAISRQSPFEKVRYTVEGVPALILGTGLGMSLVLLTVMSLIGQARGDDEFIKMDDQWFAGLFLFGFAVRIPALAVYLVFFH